MTEGKIGDNYSSFNVYKYIRRNYNLPRTTRSTKGIGTKQMRLDWVNYTIIAFLRPDLTVLNVSEL